MKNSFIFCLGSIAAVYTELWLNTFGLLLRLAHLLTASIYVNTQCWCSCRCCCPMYRSVVSRPWKLWKCWNLTCKFIHLKILQNGSFFEFGCHDVIISSISSLFVIFDEIHFSLLHFEIGENDYGTLYYLAICRFHPRIWSMTIWRW